VWASLLKVLSGKSSGHYKKRHFKSQSIARQKACSVFTQRHIADGGREAVELITFLQCEGNAWETADQIADGKMFISLAFFIIKEGLNMENGGFP
jgi:hypothetical protein